MPTKTNPVPAMLKDDHKKVKELFEEYTRKQRELVDTVVHELKVHAAVVEELIYPAIQEQIDEDALMNEATEEHHLEPYSRCSEPSGSSAGMPSGMASSSDSSSGEGSSGSSSNQAR